MGRRDELITTIEKVHAAALDPALWPAALEAVMGLIGGSAAALEVFDKRSFTHLEFRGVGIPKATEVAYLADYIADNPRWVTLMPRQKAGDVGWDFQVIDEQGMGRNAFYAKFLAGLDMRYFLSGVLTATADRYASISVQRTPRQGHVSRAEIDLMGRLLPHVAQAFEVGRRLGRAGAIQETLESAFDELADGAVIIDRDGAVVHANAAARAIAGAGDGIRIGKAGLEFAALDARTRLAMAIGSVSRVRETDDEAVGASDFTVARLSGAPSYLVSVRPLRGAGLHDGAAAIIFIRDPSSQSSSIRPLLQELFGLTAAEADLAQALREGIAPHAYARSHHLSINTVYTHLRRLHAKTGTNRMSQLIRKLNDVQVIAR